MKKVFLLGMVFTLLFSAQTSYAADATGRRETPSAVELKSTQAITYVQNTDIEIDKIRNNKEIVLVFDSSSAMEEVITYQRSPFDYALFSGSETQDLKIESDSVIIDGDVHANKSIIQKASAITLKGKMEAVGDVEIVSGAPISGTYDEKPGASVIEMKDLSDNFKAASMDKSTLFSTDPYPFDTSKRWYDLVISSFDTSIIDPDFHGKNNDGSLKDLKCSHYFNASSGRERWDISGQELILVKEKPLFFDGDLQISVAKILGDGFIVATGDIRFNTSGFESEDIGIYSVNGNLNFSTGGSTLKGVVYVPEGEIRVDSGDLNVIGCLVGNNITGGTGNVNIKYDKDLDSVKLIKTYEDLERTISVAKDASQKFIESLKNNYTGSDVKVNIVTYSDKAEVAFPVFHNVTVNGFGDPNDYIKNIDLGTDSANLGDGLRRAYFELSKSADTSADKYIVVLAAGDTNRWTQNDTPSSGLFETDDGNALDTQIKGGEVQAKNYAMEIGDKISSANIKSFFIDVNSGETIASLADIVASAGTNATLKNPEAVTGVRTFEEAVFEELVTNVADDIINEKTFITPKVTVAFTEKIPAQVEVKDAPDFNAVTPTGDLVLNNIDKVAVTEEVEKIKVSLGDIMITVKYNEFDTSDDEINYPKITATYTITNPLTGDFIGEKKADIEKLDVTIIWKKDIN